MRILLLNPPDENTIKEWARDGLNDFIEVKDYGKYPPLGLLYIIAYLEENNPGHELFLLDCVGEKIGQEELKRRIKEIKPDIAGISSFTLSMIDCCLAAQSIRTICPDAHICLGGHHPVSFPFEAAKIPQFDSIVVGEGEKAFSELVNRIKNRESIELIQGVYTRSSIEQFRGRNILNKHILQGIGIPVAYNEDLNALPFPNRKHIRHIKYFNPIGRNRNITTIISSRGCPFKCTYCDVPYKSYRKIEISRVLDEIENCLSLGYDEFHFYDDLFNITPERFIEFCLEIQKRNLRFSWDFRGRINGVTYESLEYAKKTGCWSVSFGVETGSDLGLSEIRKGITVAQIERVFKWCRKLGMETIADFMIGFPFEKSSQDVRRNIDFLIKIDPDYTLISILMLLPGTELYELAVSRGLANHDKWIRFSRNPLASDVPAVDYWTEFLSARELINLRKESYRRFYFRVKFVCNTLKRLRSFYEIGKKSAALLLMIKKGILKKEG